MGVQAYKQLGSAGGNRLLCWLPQNVSLSLSLCLLQVEAVSGAESVFGVEVD